MVLLANRDEFYSRPTAPAQWWDDQPHILGGRDLKAGGSWMVVHRNGRWAALTNYRELKNLKLEAPSRGELVTEFARSTLSSKAYLQKIAPSLHLYNGLNLIVDDGKQPAYISNRGAELSLLNPGIYGLSNHLLDTPWPKVKRLKDELGKLLSRKAALKAEDLLPLLCHKEQAPDELLPDTGVGIEWERWLSPAFIETENYGTRVSTVLLIDYEGNVMFAEKDWKGGELRQFEFEIAKTPLDLPRVR